MKKTLLTYLLLFSAMFSWAQTNTSQEIKLYTSTPQPRQGETFQIYIHTEQLQSAIFKPLNGQLDFSPSNETGRNEAKISQSVLASKTGQMEIGPIEFNINGVTYTSNALKYEVIEALPQTDEGLWIRKVMTGDKTFCIIIEQRIPYINQNSKSSKNSYSYSSSPAESTVKMKNFFSMDGLSQQNSNSETKVESITIKGKERSFTWEYGIYYFTITDPKAKIIFTKEHFENIPAKHKFENIKVQ